MVEMMAASSLDLLALVGVAGALLYMSNYLSLVVQPARAERPGYFLVNLAAAALLIISLLQDFNLGAALIQVFFLVMSLVGIVHRLHPLRRLARHRRARSAVLQPQPIRWSRPGLDRTGAQSGARSRPSQAAPRTPELSPKTGGSSLVSTRSVKA